MARSWKQLQSCGRGAREANRAFQGLAVRIDLLSGMKTVTLRSLRRDAGLLDAVAKGEALLVTRFGKPYVRIVSATRSLSFVGAGRHLGMKEPVSSGFIPQAEWKGLA
jgi:antitoxin (DNA-binding transcriptional repressor) of toxin-antitoxin stability system